MHFRNEVVAFRCVPAIRTTKEKPTTLKGWPSHNDFENTVTALAKCTTDSSSINSNNVYLSDYEQLSPPTARGACIKKLSALRRGSTRLSWHWEPGLYRQAIFREKNNSCFLVQTENTATTYAQHILGYFLPQRRALTDQTRRFCTKLGLNELYPLTPVLAACRVYNTKTM